MWPTTFEQRLVAWQQLRDEVGQQLTPENLQRIEQWWMQSPWQSYYLHWDDRRDWPDPWDLLSDNMFCCLARALGIMYTIALCTGADKFNAVLAEVDGNNLVLIDNGKYILNWDSVKSLNTCPDISKPTRQLTLAEITQRIK